VGRRGREVLEAAVTPSDRPFAKDDSLNPPPSGLLDRLVRRYSRAAYVVVVLGLYLLVATALALALAPAIWWWQWVAAGSASWSFPARGVALGFATAVGFFLFGFGLLIVIPIYNFALPTRVRPFKGGYYTLRAAPWLLHNALFYLVRFTFLPFVTLTPFGIWFLKAMRMKIGRHAFINTEYISDPQLIRIGSDAALGGSVHIFAHYGGGGHLVVAPVEIGDRATIGLAATVMGDVHVGPDAVVLPHSVLLPGSRVGAGETWGGVPARLITREEMDAFKEGIQGIRHRNS
jgi:acetyltransferase-like isoleucine patch superfamily enzyme